MSEKKVASWTQAMRAWANFRSQPPSGITFIWIVGQGLAGSQTRHVRPYEAFLKDETDGRET